jgi:hypothetical protein
MSFLPINYKDSKTVKKETGAGGDPRYIDPSKLEDGQSVVIRPCGTFGSGHVICGYQYFSETIKRTRRFPEFPENYLDDIGLTYEGRTKNTGEKDTPKYFLAFTCLAQETNQFSIVFVPQLKLREKLERIFAIPDYAMEEGGIANFYLTLSRTGLKTDTSYDAIAVLKPASDAIKERWQEAKGKIWLPALYDGADPFAGQPAESAKGQAPVKRGQPPEPTDALGAVAEPTSSAPGGADDW